MNPYSVDLRQRAVSAYERGEGSYVDIARRYEVCADTLRDWCSRYRKGSLAPLPHSGGDRSILTDEDRDHIVKTAMDRNDATLAELGDDLAAQRGVRVTEKTIGVVLQERKITRKKRPVTQPSAKPRNGKPSEKPTNKK
jgi:transposase